MKGKEIINDQYQYIFIMVLLLYYVGSMYNKYWAHWGFLLQKSEGQKQKSFINASRCITYNKQSLRVVYGTGERTTLIMAKMHLSII